MERNRPAAEQAHLQSPVAALGQVRQLRQGVGVGDRQVVRRENADAGAPVQRVLQGPEDAGQAALHDEGDRHVDAVETRVPEPIDQMRQQPTLSRTVEQHRRGATPTRHAGRNRTHGKRARVPRRRFSRHHAPGLYARRNSRRRETAGSRREPARTDA